MRIVHFFSSFSGLGGVQSVLRHHHRKDAAAGLDSEFLIYLGSGDEALPRVHLVGPGPRDTLLRSRRRVRKCCGAQAPEVAVYHGLWGLPRFADLDGSRRRVQVVHGQTPGMAEGLREHARLLDGVLCVSEPLQAEIRRILGFPAERVGLLPYPIEPQGDAGVHQSGSVDRPLVIGLAARLEREQKRVDRLPELVRELDRTGVGFTLEILGTGGQEASLNTQFAGDPRIVFHGRRSGAEYWRIVRGWDAIVFLSEYEGLPIALLEALSVGVIPIFPRIGSGGDEYVARINPRLVYEPGDLRSAAAAHAWLAGRPQTERSRLRQSCRDAVASHLGNGYLEAFSGFVTKIMELPPLAGRVPQRQSQWNDCVPLFILNRIRGLRSRIRRPLPANRAGGRNSLDT